MLMSVAKTDITGQIVLGIIVALLVIVIIIMAIVIYRLRHKGQNQTPAALGLLFVLYIIYNSMNDIFRTCLF